jgi:CHAT domain-containing protein/Flp pilus assembly protein TadD
MLAAVAVALMLSSGGEAPRLSECDSLDKSGRHEEAIPCWTQAAKEAHESNDIGREKQARANLAWAQWAANRFEASIATFNDVVALARATNDRLLEASTINFTGLAYQNLGDVATARAKYEQAYALAKALGDDKLLGEVLYHLARLRFYLGQTRESIPLYEQSLTASLAAHDLFGEGETLASLGMAYHSVGENEKSIDTEQRAIVVMKESRDRRGEADALDHIGIALTDLNRANEAQSYHRQALDVRREINDRFGSALSLSALARAQKMSGEIDAAIESQQKVIDIIESARQSLDSRALRGSMFASRAGHYTRMIDLLMDARREADALSMSERARARLTLDALQATPLTTEEIQRDVLDADTALVEYTLGNERSFVWVATKTSITSRILPKREEIESAARHLHELLAAPEERKRQHAIEVAVARFSKLILPPLPRNVTRLLIVADGALHFVPFAILTTDYEIVNTPSASVIAFVRKREPAPSSTIAVVADPVFRADDPRVSHRGAVHIDADVMRAATESGLKTLERLPWTRVEADAIKKLASSSTLEALDFDASRTTVTNDSFARYGIIHFATHALVNTKVPERSGIVLSLVDRNGKATNGFLRASEIYNLHLGARLVVLSACRTAIGKEVRGEGVIGLARGFMYAGAPRVVASYWSVRDSATADFMTRFYAEVVKGVPPSRALRDAQIAMRSRSPQTWAAFALYGDWR